MERDGRLVVALVLQEGEESRERFLGVSLRSGENVLQLDRSAGCTVL